MVLVIRLNKQKRLSFDFPLINEHYVLVARLMALRFDRLISETNSITAETVTFYSK